MSTYSAVVLADSPVAYWRLGESSGNPQDSAGTNHVATVGGTPTYSQPGAIADDSDTAIGFDGATEYLQVPDAAALDFGDAPFSLELWFRRTGRYATNYDYLLSKADQFGLLFQGADRILFDNNSVELCLSNTTFPSPDSDWHHVVAVHTTTDNRIYIDGLDDSLNNIDDVTGSNATDLFIGRWYSGGLWWQGDLDEIALYAAALSPGRILEHYNAGVGKFRRGFRKHRATLQAVNRAATY